MNESEERQPEEELSDGRTSSAGRSSARQKEEDKFEQMTKLLKQSEERNSEMKEEIKKTDEWRATIQKTADLHHAMLASVTRELQTQRASMKNMEMTVMTAIGGLQAAVDALVKKGAAEAGNADVETNAKVRRVGDYESRGARFENGSGRPPIKRSMRGASWKCVFVCGEVCWRRGHKSDHG